MRVLAVYKMKTSKYNIYRTFGGKYFVFNTLYNTSLELNKDTYVLLKTNTDFKSTMFSTQLVFNKLIKANYILDKNTDELNKIIRAYKISQHSLNTLTITIAPSLHCNFACSYCYENKTTAKMGEVNQQLLIGFIENQIKHGYKNLNLVWFGGEPLLSFDIVEKLSRNIIKLSNKYKIKYAAFITTNGYLLKEEVIKKFKTLKINQVFITLDGVGEVHERRRCLISGKGTFDVIVRNLTLLKKHNIKVLVRMNIDRSNIDHVEELATFVEDRLQLPFYLGHVRQYTDACDSNSEKYLTKEEYAKEIRQLNNYRKIKCYPISSDNPFKVLKNYCRACAVGTYVVDPDLNLYKCENDIGVTAKSIGNIRNLKSLANYRSSGKDSSYVNWEPFEFGKCKDCKLLPLCMGGCPYIGLKKSSPECDVVKFNLDYYLKNYLLDKYLTKKVASHSIK
jgi:uncharacterized protein